MRTLTVRRHKDGTVRNAFGEVARKEYYYTIAYRQCFLWWHFKFYPGGDKFHPMVRRCLEAKSVSYNEMPARMATRFYDEADAIKVKLDMIQHPDKYTK